MLRFSMGAQIAKGCQRSPRVSKGCQEQPRDAKGHQWSPMVTKDCQGSLVSTNGPQGLQRFAKGRQGLSTNDSFRVVMGYLVLSKVGKGWRVSTMATKCCKGLPRLLKGPQDHKGLPRVAKVHQGSLRSVKGSLRVVMSH